MLMSACRLLPPQQQISFERKSVGSLLRGISSVVCTSRKRGLKLMNPAVMEANIIWVTVLTGSFPMCHQEIRFFPSKSTCSILEDHVLLLEWKEGWLFLTVIVQLGCSFIFLLICV